MYKIQGGSQLLEDEVGFTLVEEDIMKTKKICDDDASMRLA